MSSLCQHGKPDAAVKLSARELAVAFFAGDDWKAVAQAERRSHDVIRKQWSRCLGYLRQAAQDEKGPLLDWARPE